MKVWLNGELVDQDERAFYADDRGALLGDGLFETIKVVGGHPLFLTEHLCRMQLSANELSLQLDRAALMAGVLSLIQATDLLLNGSIRISILRGRSPRGLAPVSLDNQSPNALISIARSTGHEQMEPDVLVMAPFSKCSDAPSSRMKTLSYADNISARAFANRHGAVDAIFVNEIGEVTSTTMANIFVEIDDIFVTPPLSAGILPGIARAQILRMANAHGIKIKIKRMNVRVLWGRWVHRTNSLIGVRPAWVQYAPTVSQPKSSASHALNLLLETAENEDRLI